MHMRVGVCVTLSSVFVGYFSSCRKVEVSDLLFLTPQGIVAVVKMMKAVGVPLASKFAFMIGVGTATLTPESISDNGGRDSGSGLLWKVTASRSL